MLPGAELVAFVATRDLDAASRFYGGVLGLTEVESGDYVRVFDADGTQLRVTLVDQLVPGSYTVLGWRVPDLAAAMRELGAHGVEFRRYDGLEQDAEGVWTAPGGSRIAWFHDPDGNTLSLQQPAA